MKELLKEAALKYAIECKKEDRENDVKCPSYGDLKYAFIEGAEWTFKHNQELDEMSVVDIAKYLAERLRRDNRANMK